MACKDCSKLSLHWFSYGYSTNLSLYVWENESGIVVICIYVDDLIVGGDNVATIEHVKTLLKQEFDMKDLGELRYFLGIEIIRTEEGIWLSQRQYALDMLSKYGMADCKPISMPLDQNLKLQADEGQVLEDVTMYQKIVGSLIYLTISRSDLSYIWSARLIFVAYIYHWIRGSPPVIRQLYFSDMVYLP